MRTLAVIGAVITIATLLATPPATAPAAAEVRELAFVRGTAARSEIYTIREDGKAIRRLTNNRVSDYSPVWSPDGRQILFVSNRDGDDDLFVMDSSGARVRQVTRNRAQDLTPQWSPDGRFIAFASDRARRGEPEIWVMRADGTGARRLIKTVNHPTWQDMQFSPTWSPDGRRLMFSMAVADSNPELHVGHANGTRLKRLTRTRGSYAVYGDDTMPEWSRDGKTVVFVSNRQQRSSDIWTMSASGSGQRPLVRRPASDDWNPRLSPDGRTIAFTEHLIRSGTQSVWLVNPDGSGARRLTVGAEPHWRPKPSRIGE